MVAHRTLILSCLVALSTPVQAQHGGGAPSARPAPAEATQFAFLIGQWELAVKPAASGLAQKIHGVPKMAGTWKAWRAFDGFGVEDELRITDASGNPRSLSHAMRYYDATAKRWSTTTLDVYRGVFTASTANWRDGKMVVTSRGVDGDGKAYVVRVTYSDITPQSFRFRQDRSVDDGQTWAEGVLVIDAKRVATSASR
ncbi:MAG: hypothetical protein ABIT20_23550 [Gemmatimonadaceae bacterium]